MFILHVYLTKEKLHFSLICSFYCCLVEFAKWRAQRAQVHYVPYVFYVPTRPTCSTCPSRARAQAYFTDRKTEKWKPCTHSGNINEVIRAILNFFIQKFHNHKKAQNAYKRTKIKNAPKKHLRGK